MKLADFDYHLPEELIAQTPIEPRDASKLLVINRENSTFTHSHYYDLANFLQSGDVLVRNNTKVIPARFFAKKDTGGTVEILLNKKLDTIVPNKMTTWEVLTRPGLKKGQHIVCSNEHDVTLFHGHCIDFGDDMYTRIIEFDLPYPQFLSAIAEIGQTPLPPYIHTSNPKQWEARYQTLYAKHPGSAASPTAGLHMTEALEKKLVEKGIQIEEITLHVGLGTFLPVKTDDITKHHMHSERFSLSPDVAARLNEAKSSGKRIISMGTTTTRVLESCTDGKGILQEKKGETDIFIYPPYRYRFVDGLITNFHLPKSTLLMLVSALVTEPNTPEAFVSFKQSLIGRAYEHAKANNYRFFSFGDGMLIT